MKTTIYQVLGCLFMLFCAASAVAAELPGDSIYRLPIKMTDQDGQVSNLVDRRGKPQLVSMFYTSCPYICPLVIDTLKKTQRALPPEERTRLSVLLVSFDPDRDTMERLHDVFGQRKLDAATWTLARTDATGVRKLAAVLDIQYRALANRDINHTSALILLDADGRIVARTDKIGGLDPEFVSAISRLLGLPK